MAADAPLSRLLLRAASVADDLGYVAFADLSRAFGSDPASNYRVIGGHMVTALVARWGLGAELHRETGDVDLGVPPIVAQDASLVERLMDLGYQRRAGNRFARVMTDIPVAIKGEKQPVREAIVDILVPTYTSRARQNRRFGDHLVTTEVQGLAMALARDPVTMALELHRLNGETLDVQLAFPDEVSALVLKGFAAQVRSKATDAVDIWRCLEVASAAGVEATEFAKGIPAESAAVIRRMFGARNGGGMKALVGEQRLSDRAADARFTRVRALIARVLGTS
jgi:hypothetical protein